MERIITMRVLVQRVSEAAVRVDGELTARIGPGLLLLVGIGQEDVEDEGRALAPMAQKVINLRIFPDERQNMNRALPEHGGEILAVSQFTLHADCRRGRRPGFSQAATPDRARELFAAFCVALREAGAAVQTGQFGAMMAVELVNDGPVTIWLDSREVLASA